MLEYFKMPETFLFDENKNQVYPLIIKDENLNTKLKGLNKTLSIKDEFQTKKVLQKKRI